MDKQERINLRVTKQIDKQLKYIETFYSNELGIKKLRKTELIRLIIEREYLNLLKDIHDQDSDYSKEDINLESVNYKLDFLTEYVELILKINKDLQIFGKDSKEEKLIENTETMKKIVNGNSRYKKYVKEKLDHKLDHKGE